MKFGSLFSGIGGIDLGLERAGMECVWQVEIDEFCRKVLTKHWPNVPKFNDVRESGKHNLEPVDLIAGGFPCQDVSVAGARAGIDGRRSGLWREFARIVSELRPRYALVENVTGLLSDGMGRVLGDLAAIGYDAEWDVISACQFGASHTRERVFIVAYPPSDRQQRDVRETRTQKIFNVPPKALGSWNPTGGPFANFEKFLGESGSCRMADGVSSTVDIRPRLRAYGNAVAPPVAEWIGRRIIEAGEALSL